MSKKSEEERKKRVEEISKHLHPHNDEPILLPTWGITIFLKCFLLSVSDFVLCLSYL